MNMDESFTLVIKVNRCCMEHILHYLEENSYGMLCNAILFRQVQISCFVNNPILSTKQIHHQVDELGSVITSKMLYTFTGLPL